MRILPDTPRPPLCRRAGLGVFLCGALLVASGGEAFGRSDRASIDFNRDIRPILTNNCFACHGPDEDERKARLRLDRREGAIAAREGSRAVVPGDPGASELLRRVRAADPGDRMPPPESGKELTSREIGLLERWIAAGVPYDEHWSYVRPRRPELPEARHGALARGAIDRFVHARLEEEGLEPSPEAERAALVRRVSLDLTGLPPPPEDADRFIADPRPDAYERLVDRLLASPAYGEHWARMWLDLARYADSAGYADDPPRTIWAYRDWVIRAFNENRPFDRFTVEQIAGDLLPDPGEAERIATAFHRNTQTNNEGGTDDEEFRNVAVVDRVNTTMAVWMGTTMACAQCHNHKYDPISQEEYFRFFAFFNSTADADRRDESPVLELFSEAEKRQKAAWKAEIAALEERLRTPAEVADELEGARQRLGVLRKRLDEMKPSTTVPVLRELPPDRRRATRIQRRGNFLDTGKEVTRGLPSVFHSPPEGASLDRLTLARWLVDERNPLTARVVVNRYWEKLFGAGIVRTSEEFGAQGELPSHPELLDWLAVELVETGWDVKRLLRSIVTSATYRQSSRVSPELLERDPENRLLARGPRFRLSAEAIRDQALFVSGLLSRKMYGPPVRPPQPSLGLNAAFGSGIDWKTSEGEDRYRRGIYTTWRRSNPYPSMSTFDAPNREVCTVRRERTNTPLQALVTLNDPVYVEAAQALARRMAARGGSVEEKARRGFRLALGREPEGMELARLARLYEDARARFAKDRENARKMATEPLGPAPQGAEVADLAAWTVVGNVLLNLDETFMKR